jgi:hypothetical protein
MALPLVFQKISSSGFQSAIQVEFRAEFGVLMGPVPLRPDLTH